MSCPRCEEFKATHEWVPDTGTGHSGYKLGAYCYTAPPQCAFESGVFGEDNWSCETLDRLRQLAAHKDSGCGKVGFYDTAFTIPLGDDGVPMIYMESYKNHGRVTWAQTGLGKYAAPLTLEEAEQAITELEARLGDKVDDDE